MLNYTNAIIDYWAGTLDTRGVLELFSYLVKTGQAWKMQGFYGRQAGYLIDEGFLMPDGTICEDEENNEC